MSKKKVVSFCEEEIRGDTAELATKKGRQVFRKNRGLTPSVAVPGVTHSSDATERCRTSHHRLADDVKNVITSHTRATQLALASCLATSGTQSYFPNTH